VIVSIRKFRIIVLVLDRIVYWRNYSIRSEIWNFCTALANFYRIVLLDLCSWNKWISTEQLHRRSVLMAIFHLNLR